MKPLLASIFGSVAVLALVTACASQPAASPPREADGGAADAPEIEADAAAVQPDAEANADGKIPAEPEGEVASASGAESGVGTGAGADSVSQLLRDTRPRNGVPVFIGVSQRLRDRDEEREHAIDNAAEKALRYLEVRASMVLISQRSGNDVGYDRAVETRVPQQRFEDVREGLDVLQTVKDRAGTAVLVAAPQLPKLHVSIPRSLIDGVGHPSWVTQPPQIDNYSVGVGITQRRRKRADSIAAADEEALATILLERSSEVRAMGDSRTIEGQGTNERTTKAETASAVVTGFYVVSRRIGPNGRYHYALAIAPRSTARQGETQSEGQGDERNETGNELQEDQ